MRIIFFLLIAAIFLLESCTVFSKTPVDELADGYYTQNMNGSKQKVYVQVTDEAVKVCADTAENKFLVINKTEMASMPIKQKQSIKHATYSKAGFDIDFITIPLKYRAKQSDVPPQLNGVLNGAIYLGYRKDHYHVFFKKKPFNYSSREIHYTSFSLGLFTGFGNTFMSPTNTNNILQQEYDGIVWSKGIAALVSINKLNFGLGLGFDHLMDSNRKNWIYQVKPWLGLVFGLHLN